MSRHKRVNKALLTWRIVTLSSVVLHLFEIHKSLLEYISGLSYVQGVIANLIWKGFWSQWF